MGALRRHFMPEFLNRVDDIIMFKPLTIDEIKKIIDLLTEDLNRRLKARRLTLRLTDKAREFIAGAGLRSGLWSKAPQEVHAAGSRNQDRPGHNSRVNHRGVHFNCRC